MRRSQGLLETQAPLLPVEVSAVHLLLAEHRRRRSSDMLGGQTPRRPPNSEMLLRVRPQINLVEMTRELLRTLLPCSPKVAHRTPAERKIGCRQVRRSVQLAPSLLVAAPQKQGQPSYRVRQ